MNPTTFIFDLDGTLIDSLLDLATTSNQVLQEHNLPTHPIEAYRTLVGDGVRVLFQRALPEGRKADENLLDSCIAAFNRLYDQQWDQHTHPYEGITPALEVLNQRGFSLTVLSNKPHPFTVACVDKYFPQIPFQVVLGNSPDLPRKPDPAGVYSIADRLSTSPQHCIYVGDTNTDMQTAIAAGCHAVGVTWGFRSEQELISSGAQTILHHPEDLKKNWSAG